MLNFYLITSNTNVAGVAFEAGVNSIFLDMEFFGKKERQKTLNAHFTRHSFENLQLMSDLFPNQEVIVRLNPIGTYSSFEFNQAIKCGAKKIMIPMIRSVDDFKEIQRLSNKKVPIIYLIETKEALSSIDKWIKYLEPSDRIHFGLNDLSLSYGFKFLFSPLALGLLDSPAELLNEIGIDFGFGGIAMLGNGILDSKLILSEHARLGSKWVILSRAFHQDSAEDSIKFKSLNVNKSISELRDIYNSFVKSDKKTLQNNQASLKRKVVMIEENFQ